MWMFFGLEFAASLCFCKTPTWFHTFAREDGEATTKIKSTNSRNSPSMWLRCLWLSSWHFNWHNQKRSRNESKNNKNFFMFSVYFVPGLFVSMSKQKHKIIQKSSSARDGWRKKSSDFRAALVAWELIASVNFLSRIGFLRWVKWH